MRETNDLDERLKNLAKIKSRLYESILIMENEILKEDTPAGYQDLITLYVSLIADCAAFIQWHARQAAGCGATLKELRESVDIGAKISGDSPAAAASVAFAVETIERLFAAKTQNHL